MQAGSQEANAMLAEYAARDDLRAAYLTGDRQRITQARSAWQRAKAARSIVATIHHG